MAYAYTVGTLLIEDTFTRSGALGSTESGSLGSLAWIGDTAKLPCNGSEAVAVNPANAVGVIGNVYVNVPAGLSVRVAAETNSAAFDSFANAYLGVTARGDVTTKAQCNNIREAVTGYRPRVTTPGLVANGASAPAIGTQSVVTIFLDVIGNEWYGGRLGQPGSTFGPFVDPVNHDATRVGMTWRLGTTSDVMRFATFRVWELVPTSPPVLTHTGAMTT